LKISKNGGKAHKIGKKGEKKSQKGKNLLSPNPAGREKKVSCGSRAGTGHRPSKKKKSGGRKGGKIFKKKSATEGSTEFGKRTLWGDCQIICPPGKKGGEKLDGKGKRKQKKKAWPGSRLLEG